MMIDITQPYPPAEPEKQSKRVCSYCKQPGHNSRTCTAKAKAAAHETTAAVAGTD